jgi:hypothetical protein
MAGESLIDRLYAEPIRRANEYVDSRRRKLGKRLGYGQDGIVFATILPDGITGLPSVVKSLKHPDLYEQELRVYRRLHELGVRQVLGFNVPLLVQHSAELSVIEMTAVAKPFVLDFVSAGVFGPLNHWPDYKLREQRAIARESFGPHWQKVQEVIAAFRQLGIYLADVKRGNIEFAD